MTTIGAILLAFAAFALVTGLATDAIPANWPFQPKGREEHPKAFRLYVYGWSAAGIVGVILIIAGLLRA